MENTQIEKGKVSSRNQFNFLFGRITSELGSSILKFATSLYVLDQTGSVSIFSTVLALSMVPSIFINIFAGVLVDRSNKKKIMVLCDLISAIATAIFVVLLNSGFKAIGILLVYLMLISIIQSLFSITIYAAIPNFFENEKIMQVNSSYQGTTAIINILGPVLGGVLYSLLAFHTLAAITGLIYFVSAISELFLVYFENNKKNDKDYGKNIKDVYNYIISKKVILYLLVIVLLINFVSIPLTSVILPYLGYQIMLLSSTQLGIVQGMWSAGIIFGSMISSIKKIQSKITIRLFRFLQIQGVVIALWMVPLLVREITDISILSIVIFSVILFIGGALNIIINIPLLTYIQISIPENLRASIYGVVTTCTMIAAPIGIWFYGILIEKVNIQSGVIFSSIVVLIVSTIAVCNKDITLFFANDFGNTKE